MSSSFLGLASSSGTCGHDCQLRSSLSLDLILALFFFSTPYSIWNSRFHIPKSVLGLVLFLILFCHSCSGANSGCLIKGSSLIVSNAFSGPASSLTLSSTFDYAFNSSPCIV